MSLVTLISLLVVVLVLVKRLDLPAALALGGATPAGAAVALGPVVVPTFYAMALVAALVLALRVVSPRLAAGTASDLPPARLTPVEWLLVLFAGWTFVVTLASPIAFDGQTVITPTASTLAAGHLTLSNIAQLGYLALGIAVVVVLSRSARTRPQVLGTSLGVCLALCAWRYLHGLVGVPFPEGVFDNSPEFVYIETVAGGGQRFRGILSEPAALASTCLVGIAYFTHRAAQVGGARRMGCLVLATSALVMGAMSTSATFVVAGLVLLGLRAATFALAFLHRRATVGRMAMVAAGLVIALASVSLPVAVDAVGRVVDSKVGSSSFSERSTNDAASLDVFLDTFGMGVGLGAARASSFVPTLLSATGVIGAALLLGALGLALARGSRLAGCRPVVWALIALLVVKATSSPDLHDPSGTLWLALGVLCHAMASRGSDRGWVAPRPTILSARADVPRVASGPRPGPPAPTGRPPT